MHEEVADYILSHGHEDPAEDCPVDAVQSANYTASHHADQEGIGFASAKPLCGGEG